MQQLDMTEAGRLAFDAWRQFDGNKTHAAESLGWGRSTFRHRLNLYFEKQMADEIGIEIPEGYRVNSRSVKLREDGTIAHQFVKLGKAPDEEQFEIPDGHVVKGVSAFVDQDGRVMGKWVKTREGERTVEQLAEAMEIAAASYQGAAAPIQLCAEAVERTDPDLLNVHLLPDLHVGMSARITMNGTEWNRKVAELTYKRLFRLLTERAPFAQTGVLLFGGDTTHYDDPLKATRGHGNALSGPADGTYPEVLSTAQQLAVYHVEIALQKYEKVVVVVLEGNHDPDSAVAIRHFLAAWFRLDPRVEIDTSDSIFWFYEHGVNMFGATHGHKAKISQMPGIMAADEPEMWGRTKHRFAFGFHVHHKTKSTGREGGATFETFETPVPLDLWHYEEGYRSSRSLCVRTYHHKYGMSGEATEMLI